MKRIVWILSSVIIFSLLATHITSYQNDFRYQITPLHNEYRASAFINRTDGKEIFSLTVFYYKLARKLVFDLVSNRGQTGTVEADAPDDPMLYDVMCTSQIKKSCPAFNEFPDFTKICEASFRKYFFSEQERAELRQSYEDKKQANVDIPPLIISPKENSTHVAPGNLDVELKLNRLAVTPCKRWTFTVVFDRWDSSKGSNGEWVSGPHSYSTFQGYEMENASFCLAKYPFSFMPGKYRVTARAKNNDGRQTPWSPHTVFTVTMERKYATRPPGIYISSPKSGDSFTQGDLIHVRWSSVGVDQNVKVGIVKGNTIIVFTPAGGIPDRGYWRGPIPSDVPPDTYRLGVATADNSIRGFLENITIKKKLTVIKKKE